MHDELEAETIRTSVFRHKLSFFEKNLNKEIQGILVWFIYIYIYTCYVMLQSHFAEFVIL